MKRRRLLILLLGLAALLLGGLVHWYLHGVTVKGRLLDAAGQAIDYASVCRIRSVAVGGTRAVSQVNVAECDAEGRFQIPDVRRGPCRLLFSIIVLEPGLSCQVDLEKRTVAVGPDDIDLGDIRLDVAASVSKSRRARGLPPVGPTHEVTVAAPEGQRVIKVGVNDSQ